MEETEMSEEKNKLPYNVAILISPAQLKANHSTTGRMKSNHLHISIPQFSVYTSVHLSKYFI
jgi:hypothetical protein